MYKTINTLILVFGKCVRYDIYSYTFIFSLLLITHIGSLFDALVCFLLFNSADFVGRYLSNWFKMVRTDVYMYSTFHVICMFFKSSFINKKRDTCPEKKMGFEPRSFWLLVRRSINLYSNQKILGANLSWSRFYSKYIQSRTLTFSLYCLVILIFTCTCSLDNCCNSFHVIMAYDYVSSIVISNKYKRHTNWIVSIVSYHNRHGQQSVWKLICYVHVHVHLHVHVNGNNIMFPISWQND